MIISHLTINSTYTLISCFPFWWNEKMTSYSVNFCWYKNRNLNCRYHNIVPIKERIATCWWQNQDEIVLSCNKNSNFFPFELFPAGFRKNSSTSFRDLRLPRPPWILYNRASIGKKIKWIMFYVKSIEIYTPYYSGIRILQLF